MDFGNADMEVVFAMFGAVFYLMNLFSNITFAWIKSKLPVESVLTPAQSEQLATLYRLHNAIDDNGQPRWYTHPQSYESQQQMVALLQSMAHNMSTHAQHMQDAQLRNTRASDQMFKLIRELMESGNAHNTEVSRGMGILMERTAPVRGK